MRELKEFQNLFIVILNLIGDLYKLYFENLSGSPMHATPISIGVPPRR